MTDNKIGAFAERLKKLAIDYRADRAAVLDKARNAGIETATLQRLATWMRKDELARLEQEALDDQYRFLAGLRPEGAEMPSGGQLATAAALYANKLSVRAVAKKMGISIGKAHTLKMKAAAFNVQPHANMNAASETADQPAATDSDEDGSRTEASNPAADPGSDEDDSRAQASKAAGDDLAIPWFLDRRAANAVSITDPSNT